MQDFRREFKLPREDEEYLDSLNLKWETAIDNGTQWLVIHGWVLPQGFNVKDASLALSVPSNYPESEINMIYVKPDLAKTDSGIINALTSFTIFGEPWQQWSRHRTGENPWIIGEDDVSTHLTLADEWFRREIGTNEV